MPEGDILFRRDRPEVIEILEEDRHGIVARLVNAYAQVYITPNELTRDWSRTPTTTEAWVVPGSLWRPLDENYIEGLKTSAYLIGDRRILHDGHGSDKNLLQSVGAETLYRECQSTFIRPLGLLPVSHLLSQCFKVFSGDDTLPFGPDDPKHLYGPGFRLEFGPPARRPRVPSVWERLLLD